MNADNNALEVYEDDDLFNAEAQGGSAGSKAESKPTSKAESEPTNSTHHSLSSETYRPITAAIDFGTSGSSFALNYDDNDIGVYVKTWTLGSTNTEKAPTTILLKPDKTFDSFGYEAESRFADLCDDGQQKGWRYFQDFKMSLYQKKKITREMEIFDHENKPMRAVDVFSAALAYLKQQIIDTVRLQKTNVSDDDVLYVITIPAIWSDASKQFMREAAKTAGISNDRLRLVLKPEAAAVYCAQMHSERRCHGTNSFESLPVGHRYILVDMGGGTIDIATHEVREEGQVLELYVARGDDFAGQYFNKECLTFFKQAFGYGCFEQWKTGNCDEFLKLQRTIEEFKKIVSISNKDVKFSVFHSLVKIINTSWNDSIASLERVSSHAVKSSKDEKIVIKNEFLKVFLEVITSGIEQHINGIISEVSNIQTIFLVGGLANSQFIRDKIKFKFSQYSLIVPEDPGVAVLKGAVQLGNRPQIIAGRIARYSYGTGICQDFVDGKHREDYKFTRDGEVLCENVFKKLIKKGQMLKYGDKFTTITCINAVLPETKLETFSSYLYQSTQPSPTYHTDEGCTELGGFEEHPPEGGWSDYSESTVNIIVGEAEFKFYVKDDLGREYETQVDFLLPDK